MENWSRNFSEMSVSWSWAGPFYWKTYPFEFLEFQFSHNRVTSQTLLVENSSNRQFENLWGWHRPLYWKNIQLWMTFPVIRSSTWLENWKKIKKKWMNFPLIRFGSWRGKLKFLKHLWVSFPGFTNKGWFSFVF